MGLSIYNKNGNDVDMSYSSFHHLRVYIAKIINAELGEWYGSLPLIYSIHQMQEDCNHFVDDIHIPSKILDFLLASDCDGKINHKTIKTLKYYFDNSPRPIGTIEPWSFQRFYDLINISYSKRMNIIWD